MISTNRDNGFKVHEEEVKLPEIVNKPEIETKIQKLKLLRNQRRGHYEDSLRPTKFKLLDEINRCKNVSQQPRNKK